MARRANPGEDAAEEETQQRARRPRAVPRNLHERIVLAVPTDPRHRRSGREPREAVPVTATLARREHDGAATLRIDGVHSAGDDPRSVILESAKYVGSVEGNSTYGVEWKPGQWATLRSAPAPTAVCPRSDAWHGGTVHATVHATPPGSSEHDSCVTCTCGRAIKPSWVRAEDMEQEFPGEAAAAVEQFLRMGRNVD